MIWEFNWLKVFFKKSVDGKIQLTKSWYQQEHTNYVSNSKTVQSLRADLYKDERLFPKQKIVVLDVIISKV